MAQMSLMGIYVHSHIHVSLYMYTVMSIGNRRMSRLGSGWCDEAEEAFLNLEQQDYYLYACKVCGNCRRLDF